MNKNLIALAFCLLLKLACFAQGNFSGKIIDKQTNQPLALATITIFKAADTTMLQYKLSKENGEFKATGIPLNLHCRAVITFSGYKVFRKDFTLTDSLKNIDIGTIGLDTDSASLDEVLVIAERPPMIVKNDTIEFNAAAFKTLPNAMVEDLLKKLPGVTVDNDGNISVAGKRVNKILVDGKTFFGEDPKMASRNLPSYVIDKVQVTDDKDELLRNGDDNLNNVGKVINLTFKKGMKKGMFGKAYAGGGGGNNGDRFEAGAIANVFRDTLQVSLLGYTNNLNRPGFSYSDILQTGGIGRNRDVTGSQSVMINIRDYGSGITINGINFGGLSQQGGISTSNGLGLNFNHSPNKKQSIYAQYFFGNVKTDLEQRNYTQITNGDSIITNNEVTNGAIINNAHNMSAGINLKPDSLTTFQANVNYIAGTQNNNNTNITDGRSNILGLLNESAIDFNNKISNNQLSQRATYTRLSKNTKGRKFTLGNYFNWNSTATDAYTTGNIHYHQPTAYDSILGQYRNERVPNVANNIIANYSEPLATNWFLRFGANYQFEKLKNNTATFNKNGNDYNLPNSDLTNNFERTSNRFGASVGLEYRYKSLTITPGIKYQYQNFENKLSYIAAPVVQKLNNLLPQLGITYKRLNINYNRNVVLPSYQYLIPVKNNSNPYFVNLGNPDLLPAVKDEVYINYNHYAIKSSLNVWGWASASLTNNDVIQSVSINESGIQTSLPGNADGTKQLSANFGVNKQYKNKRQFTFLWNVGNYTQYRQNPFIFNNITSTQSSLYLNGWGGFGLNWNDVLEWNNSFGISYQQLRNSNKKFTQFNTLQNSVGSELIVRWPKHVIIETKATYGTNSQIVDPAFRNYFLWNAAVNFTMFKDERGVLKLGVYDLLNQSRSVDVTSTQNTVRTSYNNIIGQYFMATFTYNIRQAGAKKKVGGSMWLF